MTLRLLVAGTAIIALAAGAVQAATPASATGGAYAAPSQPIAYSRLGAYLRASPTRRAHGDWGIGADASGAQTGTPANTSANAPQSGLMQGNPTPTPANGLPATDGSGVAPPAPDAAQPPAGGATPDLGAPPPAPTTPTAPPAGSTPMQTPPAPQ